MGQKQPGGPEERTLTSSPSLHASSTRGKSMKQLPIPEDSGASSSTSFSRRIARNSRYDDVAGFKVRLVYDEVRNLDKLDRFLKAGGDINYVPHAYGLYDWTLLHWAAFYKATNSVKLLVTNGANVNLKTADGEVPARIAKNMAANAEILRLCEAGRLLGGT